jgi:hypothetical protein
MDAKITKDTIADHVLPYKSSHTRSPTGTNRRITKLKSKVHTVPLSREICLTTQIYCHTNEKSRLHREAFLLLDKGGSSRSCGM